MNEAAAYFSIENRSKQYVRIIEFYERKETKDQKHTKKKLFFFLRIIPYKYHQNEIRRSIGNEQRKTKQNILQQKQRKRVYNIKPSIAHSIA